jgi:TRAP-type mannitol/chloroaromatic compound transport system substrate-binding protein
MKDGSKVNKAEVNNSRRKVLLAGAGAAAAFGLASPAIAQSRPSLRWRMVTSYPKNLDNLDGGCRLLAKYVSEITDGQFEIQVFAAGEIVPALTVLDAVQAGTVECGHSTGYYYVGKEPALAFQSGVPFGFNVRQHDAWMNHGGGLALVRELFDQFNVHVIPSGNTGAQMAGWFRKELKTIDDFNGLKFRTSGMAGQILTRVGVVPQQIGGGDIYPALERGTIDAAEWVGPYDDERLGFYKVARYYYAPGWHEGSNENALMVGKNHWDALPRAYKTALEVACGAVKTWMVSKYDADNPAALRRLIANGAQLRLFSRDILDALFNASEMHYGELSSTNPRFKKVHDSWSAFRREETAWFRVNETQYDTYMSSRFTR